MPLRISNRNYEVSPSCAIFGQELLLAEYRRLEDAQFLIIPVANYILRKLEKSAKKKGLPYEHFRVPKKADPAEHLIRLLGVLIAGVLYHVTITINTSEDSVISSVSLTDQAGRPLDPDGSIRLGEDNRLQIPGQLIHQALPEHAALHSGQQA